MLKTRLYVVFSVLMVFSLIFSGCKKKENSLVEKIEEQKINEKVQEIIASGDSLDFKESSKAVKEPFNGSTINSKSGVSSYKNSTKQKSFDKLSKVNKKVAVRNARNSRRGSVPIKDKSLKNIKQLYNKGYFGSIAKTTFNKNQLHQLYYKALSYYNGAIRNKDIKTQNGYAGLAKNILKKVTVNTDDPILASRAILWYGIVNFRYPESGYTTEDLSEPFIFLQKNYQESRVFNDAIFYAGLVYHREGNPAYARSYYEKLKKSDQNDLVYDYRRNRMVNPARAARYYLAILDRKNSSKERPKSVAPSVVPDNVPPAAQRFNSSEKAPVFPKSSELEATGKQKSKTSTSSLIPVSVQQPQQPKQPQQPQQPQQPIETLAPQVSLSLDSTTPSPVTTAAPTAPETTFNPVINPPTKLATPRKTVAPSSLDRLPETITLPTKVITPEEDKPETTEVATEADKISAIDDTDSREENSPVNQEIESIKSLSDGGSKPIVPISENSILPQQNQASGNTTSELRLPDNMDTIILDLLNDY